MPNECSYTMYAEGKPEAIDELIARMTFKYDHSEGSEVENRVHFWRVLEANVEELEPRTEGTRLISIAGYCAWSVRACMFDGENTYAGDRAKDPELAPYCTSLEKTAKELGLEIEVFSDEAGVGFAEHYHYAPYELPVEESCDFEEVFWDPDEYPTFADLDADYDLTEKGVKESDCGPYEYITIGGYDHLTPFCYEKETGTESGLDVVLSSDGGNRIAVVKAIRRLTDLGLREATAAAKNAPIIIAKNATREDAEAIKRGLEEAGATVNLM